MLVLVIVFLLGLFVGSFLNCLIYRLWHKESFLKGRSYCPKCSHKLNWYDLIPVLSFLILRGKCRYCQKKISWQYPLVEISTALTFLLIFNLSANGQLPIHSASWRIAADFQNLIATCYLLLVSCFLIIIFVYDLKHYIIPDKVVYPAILISGTWYLVSGIFFNLYTKYEILNTVYAAIGAAAFFLFIVLVSQGKWMGLGDVKLVFLMGLLLGFPNILVALFLAFFIGAIIGIGLIIFGKKSLKSEIPFGPFLVSGTFIAVFFSQNLISWYLNLLL